MIREEIHMFNYNHLYYFYVAAKLKGVTAAARFLNTSQSSLSTQLKTLENSIGHNLFQKVGRHLELTHEGQIIFGYCRRMFEVTEELADYLNDSSAKVGPPICLGVGDEIERPFVTEIIGQVLRKIPKDQKPFVKMAAASHENLVSRLSLGEVDLILTTQQVYNQETEVICEVSLPIVCVGRSGLLAESLVNLPPPVALKNIDAGLALPSPEMKLRHEIDNYIHRQKIKKNAVFESNILGSVTRAILDGIGIGFLPLPYVHKEVRLEQLDVIGGKPLWNQKFFLVSTLKQAKFIFAKEFSEQLRSFAQTFKM